jgi:hypothetical protein
MLAKRLYLSFLSLDVRFEFRNPISQLIHKLKIHKNCVICNPNTR